MMKRSFLYACSLAALAGGLSVSAQAQTADNSNNQGTADIIVTAQKRSENLQKVPLAVSAVSSAQLTSRGFSNIAQLSQLAPNVNLSEGIVNPTIIVPFIRGIGSVDNQPELDLPVAVSIDGVYLASAYGGLVDTFDIQQVEVLRGPQGTLQGRNAPAGAVNITTRRPGDTLVERGMIQYGRFNDLRVNAGIDGPLIGDKVGFKLAIMRRKSDGYVKNVTTDQDFGGRNTWAFKGGLSIKPVDRLKVWLSADYMRDTSEPVGFRPVNDGINHPRTETDPQLNTYACILFGYCTPYPKYTTGQLFFGNNFVTNLGLTSNIDYDAGAVSLTSVTGYRKILDQFRLDIDALPPAILEVDPTTLHQKTFSQEFRIASNDGGPLSFNNHVRWLLGGYYLHHRFTRFQRQFVLGSQIGDNYGQLLKDYALFGHVDVMPTDKLTLSAGVRQMWDKKDFISFNTGIPGKQSFSKFVFDANVNYKFTRDIMAYARFARGYRPGGFNSNGIVFNPENVDSYEGGVKSQFFDRRLTVNLTGFYYKYTNLQRQSDVSVTLPDGTQTFTRVTSNVGAQHAEGFEAEITGRPTPNLNINFSLGYLKSKYDKFLVSNAGVPVDDSHLPVFEAPKLTLGAGASYDIQVNNNLLSTVTPAVNIYHKSSYYTQAAAQPVSYQSGYVLLNSYLKFRDASKRFAFTIFGDNLLNQYYLNSGGTLGGLGLYVQDAPPRTYGVRFEFEF